MRIRFIKQHASATTIYKKNRIYDTKEESITDGYYDFTFPDGDSLLMIPAADIELVDQITVKPQPKSPDYSRPCCTEETQEKKSKKK